MTLRGMLTPARLRSAALPAASWAWTRGVLLMFVYSVVPYISHGDIIGDVKLYNRWSQIFAQGRFPRNDPTWQYPPGAGIVIAVPRLIRSITGMSYYSAFYTLALVSDLIVFLLVIYRCWRTAEETGHERADYLGAYMYVAAIFMLGPIVFGRYDIAVTMIASVGLAVALRTAVWTWRVRGVAIGLGAIVKVWPVALIFGLPRGPNGRRAVVWAVIGGAVPTLILVILFPGALSFLTQQHDRGLEVESVLATPFLLARHLGYHGVIKNRYGSFEIIGPGIGSISRFCELLTLLGFCWLLWWRRRARLTPQRWSEGVYYDAALVAVLISIITSRVLSPQYLVWICGLVALCLALTPLPRGGTVLAGPCWLLMATISITQLEFPLLFSRLLKGNTTAAIILTCRNSMLVIATVWAGYLLWRAYALPKQKVELVEAEVERTTVGTGEMERNRVGIAAETADSPDTAETDTDAERPPAQGIDGVSPASMMPMGSTANPTSASANSQPTSSHTSPASRLADIQLTGSSTSRLTDNQLTGSPISAAADDCSDPGYADEPAAEPAIQPTTEQPREVAVDAFDSAVTARDASVDTYGAAKGSNDSDDGFNPRPAAQSC